MNTIKEIINTWDPYSLFPYAPKDEYSEEIAFIEQLIREHPNPSDTDLVQYMEEVFDVEDIEKDKRNFIQVVAKIRGDYFD